MSMKIETSRRSFVRGLGLAGAALLAPVTLFGTGCAVDGTGSEEDELTGKRDPAIIRSYGGLVIPATGCYFGADDTTRGFDKGDGIETAGQLARRMAIRNRHYGFLATCPSSLAIADSKLGAPKVIPMVSLNGAGNFPVKKSGWQGGGDLAKTSFGQGIDRIANGEFDSYFGQVAKDLKALGVPVIFRLWMEMNGAHNPYFAAWQGGVGGKGEAAFAAAFAHIRQVFKTEKASIDAGGNCVFVFCPQTTSSGGNWQAYWPGDGATDFMGLDLYRNTFANDAADASANRNFYGLATTKKKPFMICEAGFEQGQVVTTPAGRFDKDGSQPNSSSLIDDTRAAIKANPQCVAYVTWNDVGPVGDDYVDTSNASLAQYKAWAHDPYFALTRS